MNTTTTPETETEPVKIPDPRTERTEAAFDLIETWLHDQVENPPTAEVRDALRLARSLMVPTAGPRPLDGWNYYDPANRWTPEGVQMLTDVLDAAVVSIGYWCSIEVYATSVPPAERRIEIVDDEGKRHRIDLHTIHEGMVACRHALRQAEGLTGKLTCDWPSPTLVPRIGSEFFDQCRTITALLHATPRSDEYDEAESEFDAGCADTVVQMALFGQLVYG